MTPLAALLCRYIARHGAMPFATFMARCLTHPRHGYYTGKAGPSSNGPFGRAGDFTTAPEISQMFGELIGLWMLDCWIKLGAPRTLRIVELGPGRGVLMADALRAAALRPDFLTAADLHLVDVSPTLQSVQKERLTTQPIDWHQSIHWHTHVESLPTDGPLIFIANEFFDALPVHILRHTKQGWRECYVDRGTDNTSDTDDTFVMIESSVSDLSLIPDTHATPGPQTTGTVREVRPAAARILSPLLAGMARNGGYGLVIDYGYLTPPGHQTVTAVRRHRHVSPLSAPGQTDLSAHVDFSDLAHSGLTQALPRTITVHGPVSQAHLLTQLGIARRAQTLLAGASTAQQHTLKAGVRRLLAPSQMGAMFRAMAFSTSGLAAPDGFIPPEDAPPDPALLQTP